MPFVGLVNALLKACVPCTVAPSDAPPLPELVIDDAPVATLSIFHHKRGASAATAADQDAAGDAVVVPIGGDIGAYGVPLTEIEVPGFEVPSSVYMDVTVKLYAWPLVNPTTCAKVELTGRF